MKFKRAQSKQERTEVFFICLTEEAAPFTYTGAGVGLDHRWSLLQKSLLWNLTILVCKYVPLSPCLDAKLWGFDGNFLSIDLIWAVWPVGWQQFVLSI